MKKILTLTAKYIILIFVLFAPVFELLDIVILARCMPHLKLLDVYLLKAYNYS